MKRTLLLLTAAALVGTWPAAAGGATAAQEPPVRENPVALLLAEAAGVPYEQIRAYQQAGYGLGEINRALAFAELTDQGLDQALKRGNEIGWGQLFLEAGLEPGMKGRGLGGLVRQSKAQQARVKRPGPPEHAGPKGKGGG